MPGTFSAPSRVSNPDINHGPRVVHVPWSMPGSLIRGFLRSRWEAHDTSSGKHFFPVGWGWGGYGDVICGETIIGFNFQCPIIFLPIEIDYTWLAILKFSENTLVGNTADATFDVFVSQAHQAINYLNCCDAFDVCRLRYITSVSILLLFMQYMSSGQQKQMSLY